MFFFVVVIDQTVIRHPPSITPSSIAINHLHHLHHNRVIIAIIAIIFTAIIVSMIISCLLSSTTALKSLGETILNITVLLQSSPSSIEIITTSPQIAFLLLSLFRDIGIIPLLNTDK